MSESQKKRLSFLDIFRRKDRKIVDNNERYGKLGFSFASEPSGLFGKNSDHNLFNMEKWEMLYSSDGLVFSAVNSIAHSALGNGYKIQSSNPEAVRLVNKLLEHIDLDELLSGIIRHIVIFGDAYIEKIYSNSGNLVSLDLVDPKTIEIVTDDYGEVQHYKQTIMNGQKAMIIEPEEIVHIRLYSIPSSPYGVSIIGTNYDTIIRKLRIDSAIASAIIRHGSPKYHISVGGPDGDLPPEEVLEDLRREFKDIDEKNEFITSSLIDIEGVDTRGIDNIEEYYTYFIDLISSGFCVPAEQLGITVKGNTEASSKTRERLFNRYLRAIQKRIERIFEQEIFKDAIKNYFPNDSVKLTFKDISAEDEALKIRWIRPFINVLGTEKEVLTKDEIRDIFGFPPLKSSIKTTTLDDFGFGSG